MGSRYTPRYVSWSEGEGRSPELRSCKAYQFRAPFRANGPCVFWETRCLVGPLNVESQGNYWTKWYKQHGKPSTLVDWLDLLGSKEEDWRPSMKQAKSAGWSAVDREGLLPEAIASSHHVLLHLVDWSVRLRGGKQYLASAVGADLLRKLLASLFGDDLPEDLACIPRLAPDLCRRRARGSDTCVHCARVGNLVGAHQPVPTTRAFDFLLGLWRHRSLCPLVHRWCWDSVRAFAAHMDRSMGEGSKFPISAENMHAQRSNQKRRRIDHDMAYSAIFQSIRSKKFRVPQAAARSRHWDVAERRARRQNDLHMRKYMQASFDKFSGMKQLHIALDESSLGGEATMLAAVVDPHSQMACWVVPQVPSSKTTTG